MNRTLSSVARTADRPSVHPRQTMETDSALDGVANPVSQNRLP
jgi:hypothetical protein